MKVCFGWFDDSCCACQNCPYRNGCADYSDHLDDYFYGYLDEYDEYWY
jgi:hypothetical protein